MNRFLADLERPENVHDRVHTHPTLTREQYAAKRHELANLSAHLFMETDEVERIYFILHG